MQCLLVCLKRELDFRNPRKGNSPMGNSPTTIIIIMIIVIIIVIIIVGGEFPIREFPIGEFAKIQFPF